MRFLIYAVASLTVLLTLFAAPQSPARAGVSVATDRLPVVATADIASRLGNERVHLIGWGEVQQSAPHQEAGVRVVDLEISRLDLQGASSVGVVTVAQQSQPSVGELRSLQAGSDFPASSFLDLLVNVTVPASPIGSLEMHNTQVFHLTPRANGQPVPLQQWPPLGVTYQMDPIFGVNNDGDTQIDEDTADDDHDGLIDEDRSGLDPIPIGADGCGADADCDDREGEDPPANLCPAGVPGTPTLCDGDGDGQIDEDPACIPLLDPVGTNLKLGLCIRTLSLEIAPEMPSYSVARGGPSRIHPASILGLTPRDEPPAQPVSTSGNDNFANAWNIGSAPFIGTQSTAGMTLESINTGFLSPSGQEAVTTGAGDNDGFETNPTGTFADGGGAAEDNDSGSDPKASCGSVTKDQHLYRDFNIDPGSINGVVGIEVFLDAWADSSDGAPVMCVQLSPDAGQNWAERAFLTGQLTDSEATYVVGGVRQTWRFFLPWFPNMLSNQNFRVRVTNISSDLQRDFRLDHLSVRVHTAVEPQPCGSIDRTTWYKFTPLHPARVLVSTAGSDFDTVLTAYTGASLYDLDFINCHDEAGSDDTQLSFSVQPENTYYIQAGGYVGAAGNLQVSLTATALQPPFVRIPCASLGLTVDGCDDGSDDNQDDLDALAYGDDFPVDSPPSVDFSAAPGAMGVGGSGVRGQRNCPPAAPGTSPEPDGDVFRSPLDGTNALFMDGNGPVGACTPAFPLGLVESASTRDDLDALDAEQPSTVDPNGDGVPELPVYFSLAAQSPSLAAFGFSAGDVLKAANGAVPTVYASAAELGLQIGDDVDGLCLREDGDGVFGLEDNLVFSLATGSPTLAQIGAGAGDVLEPGSPPTIAVAASTLGLLAGDNLDAMSCHPLGQTPQEPDGDVNCDGRTNAIDSAILLQYGASLLNSLLCPQNADVRRDGVINSIDAALILQYVAGLIDHLPFP